MGSKEETIWRPFIDSQDSLKLFLLPSLTVCVDMEQFVIVPASVYNKHLISQPVTMPQLPNYQPSQNPTYQIESLRKEINKKLFSTAWSSVDKTLSCLRIKLSNSQLLILAGVETGEFLLDVAQQQRRKNADVPGINFTLIDAAGISLTLILKQIAKTKERRSWVPSRIRWSEAAKAVHTVWCCLWVSAQLSEC